jgi:hypothetical protein
MARMKTDENGFGQRGRLNLAIFRSTRGILNSRGPDVFNRDRIRKSRRDQFGCTRRGARFFAAGRSHRALFWRGQRGVPGDIFSNSRSGRGRSSRSSQRPCASPGNRSHEWGKDGRKRFARVLRIPERCGTGKAPRSRLGLGMRCPTQCLTPGSFCLPRSRCCKWNRRLRRPCDGRFQPHITHCSIF